MTFSQINQFESCYPEFSQGELPFLSFYLEEAFITLWGHKQEDFLEMAISVSMTWFLPFH